MKTPLIAALLFAMTGGAVMLYPELGRTTPAPNQPPVRTLPAPVEAPRVEVVFVLDTTGSMGGLIQTAKEKIWSIATTMASAQPAPEIRMGLVAYRDRGDHYVTRVTDLSSDLDSVYATLMDYRAQGGGDGPESVNAALASGLDEISWSRDPNTYRVMFLVGDAPPHMDYPDEERYPEIVARAQAQGIVVNTIRCGNNSVTGQTWQHIAALAQGDYFTVDQAGSGVAITTPYDGALADLSASLDDTRVFYGDADVLAEAESKTAATAKLHAEASDASRARRAGFNASDSGKANQYGDHDLVAALASGRLELDAVEEEALPAPMRPMSPAQRHDYLDGQAKKRAQLEQEIRELSAKREAYIAEQAEELGDLSESLDYRIFESVRAQAGEKGLRYEAAAPRL